MGDIKFTGPAVPVQAPAPQTAMNAEQAEMERRRKRKKGSRRRR